VPQNNWRSRTKGRPWPARVSQIGRENGLAKKKPREMKNAPMKLQRRLFRRERTASSETRVRKPVRTLRGGRRLPAHGNGQKRAGEIASNQGVGRTQGGEKKNKDAPATPPGLVGTTPIDRKRSGGPREIPNNSRSTIPKIRESGWARKSPIDFRAVLAAAPRSQPGLRRELAKIAGLKNIKIRNKQQRGSSRKYI